MRAEWLTCIHETVFSDSAFRALSLIACNGGAASHTPTASVSLTVARVGWRTPY
jgi:hypothetical protein